MDNRVLGFCAIAAVLGIISAATAFAAEVTKVKVNIKIKNLINLNYRNYLTIIICDKHAGI